MQFAGFWPKSGNLESCRLSDCDFRGQGVWKETANRRMQPWWAPLQIQIAVQKYNVIKSSDDEDDSLNSAPLTPTDRCRNLPLSLLRAGTDASSFTLNEQNPMGPARVVSL